VGDLVGRRVIARASGEGLAGAAYEARLIPAQFVKPFVKSNKNDYLDAEAIAEAVER
jgi:transposase